MTAAADDDVRLKCILLHRFLRLTRKEQYEVIISLYPYVVDHTWSPMSRALWMIDIAAAEGTLDRLREAIESRHSEPLDEEAFDRRANAMVWEIRVAFVVIVLLVIATVAFYLYLIWASSS